MTQRFVSGVWWLTAMGMIYVCSGIALFCGYRGLLDLLGAHWNAGVSAIPFTVIAGFAALMLCKYRADLLDT